MEFLGVVDERPLPSLLDTRRRRSARSRGYIGDVVVVFWPAVGLSLVVNVFSMFIL
jgi:hypothetical protein